MVTPELVEYIRKLRLNGVAEQDILEQLVSNGWRQNNVEAALEEVQQNDDSDISAPGTLTVYPVRVLPRLFWEMDFGFDMIEILPVVLFVTTLVFGLVIYILTQQLTNPGGLIKSILFTLVLVVVVAGILGQTYYLFASFVLHRITITKHEVIDQWLRKRRFARRAIADCTIKTGRGYGFMRFMRFLFILWYPRMLVLLGKHGEKLDEIDVVFFDESDIARIASILKN